MDIATEITGKKAVDPLTDPPIRTRRIHFTPDPRDRATLRLWFAEARLAYNKGVALYHEDGVVRTITSLRKELPLSEGKKDWLKEKRVPVVIIDNALRDFVKAMASVHAKERKRGIKIDAKFGFRTRKDKQTVLVPSTEWGRSRGMFAWMGRVKYNLKEEWPVDVTHDFRVIMDRLGRYFMCLP